MLILGIFYWGSCSPEKEKPGIAFYHWKAEMDISQAEMDFMDSLSVDKLYLRFFDVLFDKERQKAVPVSQLDWNFFDMGRKMEIVPVIFITNSCMGKLTYPLGVDSLAKNMSDKLRVMIAKLDTVRFSVKEIQLDCDWTLETQSNYFRLIEDLKKYMPEISKFSATIRLHQVKYFTTTGVPPVDEGVLMFYNMGDIAKNNEKNSILNLKKAKTYLENFDVYPLKLDIALPLFSWAVQFREDKVVQLINDLSTEDLDRDLNFKKIEENRYLVLKSCYVKGIYVYKNDQLRTEGIKQEDLTNAMKLLTKTFGSKQFNLIYYHLDDYVITRFNHEQLKKISYRN
jgi:hypothetical protein